MASKPIPTDILNSNKYLYRITRGRIFFIDKDTFEKICDEAKKKEVRK